MSMQPERRRCMELHYMLQWRLLTNGNQAYRVSRRAMLSGRLMIAWITSKFSNSAVLLSQAYAALQAKLSTSRTASITSSTSTSTSTSTAYILASAAAAAAITPRQSDTPIAISSEPHAKNSQFDTLPDRA